MNQKISGDYRIHQVTSKQPMNRENAPKPRGCCFSDFVCSLVTQMSSDLFLVKCTGFFTHEVISQSTSKYWTYAESANKYLQ